MQALNKLLFSSQQIQHSAQIPQLIMEALQQLIMKILQQLIAKTLM